MNKPDNRASMLRLTPLLICLTPLAWIGNAAAETNYVIDKLLVGVHAEKSLDSAIVKVLPTGTQLEVIERDGELALIEDPDKTRGWVDAAYLTAEQPAQLLLAAAERDKAALEKQLDELKSSPAAAGAAAAAATDTAEIDALTKENTELKGKLSDELLRGGKLQSEVAELRAKVDSSTAPPDARIVELERDRDQLRGALDDAEQQVAELSARASLKSTAELVPLVVKEYALRVALGVGILLALGFACGAYALDFLNRRRHGGFRI